jgi:hypothetical protein
MELPENTPKSFRMDFIADLLIKTEKWAKGYCRNFIFESFLSRGTMLRRRLAPPVISGESGGFAGPAQRINFALREFP